MFDVGFSELMVIAVVALVVIGPERLPAVARTVGTFLGRAQRYFNSVKAEVNRELQLEELKRIQQETYDRVMSMETEVKTELARLETDVHSAVTALEDGAAHAEQGATVKADELPAPAAETDSPVATELPPVVEPQVTKSPEVNSPSPQADLFAEPKSVIPSATR